MREMISRLRAALTPQALLLLAAFLLLVLGFASKGADDSSALEDRLEKTLSLVQGAGNVRVVIKTKNPGGTSVQSASKEERMVSGVIAVAQGAADPLVKHEMETALCALLDLPPSAVSVMTGGE